jgi:D-serine deaminase-like pyridoxal phosphate-dependent protein
MHPNKPTLLVDEDICRNNIRRMQDKAVSNEVILAPHFKTHQSKAIGQWFKAAGIKAITVSSIDMAIYFAEAGWQDITIAFPLNMLQVEDIKKLAAKTQLTILATEADTLTKLVNTVDVHVDVLIEIDCGYNRSGVWWEDYAKIQQLIDALHGSQHGFKGFYCHSGQTYHEEGTEAVLAIFNDSLHKLNDLKLRFADAQPKLCVGDTPSCSLSNEFPGVYSIHPGNFVFYDLTQVKIGSCTEQQIGISLASPVVSKNERLGQIIIHGGGVHLSKDVLETSHGKIYGKMVALTDQGWTFDLGDNYLVSVSQEHGILKVSPKVYEQISVGDVIGILPVHSCMTADVMGEMYTTSGQQLDHLKKVNS